jgi:predicted short-subunit dehydrogenase-like oxidoreductase (DUF2520 family)
VTAALRVAILGAGRVGCSIHRGLTDAGQTPVLLWTRSAASHQAALAAGFPVTTGALPSVDAELILLTVEDSAVASLALHMKARASTAAVLAHTAGALDLTPLDGWPSKGSFHPIVSVASRTTSLASAFAAIAASDEMADARLLELARLLRMGVVHPTGDRARYHAAAAIAGNFPQVLLEAASRVLRDCGLSADEARQAFGPLLESAARNAAALGPSAGLTGPVVRGDVATVQRHLNALAGSDTEALYRMASLIATDLAEQRGAPNLEALRALLARPD